MKNPLILMIIGWFWISCNPSSDSNDTQQSIPHSQSSEMRKDFQIKMEILEGKLKGTYLLELNPEQILSNVAISEEDDYSNLNANNLISKNDLMLESLTRTFSGKITNGSHDSYMTDNNKCGTITFRDDDLSRGFWKARGEFKGCTGININKASDWKEATVQRKRSVEGSFKDEVTFEFSDKDGNTQTASTPVSISFVARQSEIKK